jgi:hypothetical protein
MCHKRQKAKCEMSDPPWLVSTFPKFRGESDLRTNRTLRKVPRVCTPPQEMDILKAASDDEADADSRPVQNASVGATECS